MHTLALKIDYKNGIAGWINCALLIDGERHPLDASVVFPPFLPLLRFVKAVAGQRFPTRYSWDEEGVEAKFEAIAVPNDSSLMHLKIIHDESDTPWFDDVIEREAFIQAFLPPILDFSQNYLLSETEWYLPKKLVARLHQAIVSGIPSRSDTSSPQAVECEIVGGYDHGYVEGRVFFRISFDEEDLISILMFDTDPFWAQLVEWMGNIATENFPATCEHLRVLRWDLSSEEAPYESQQKTRFAAEPLDVPENLHRMGR